MKNAQNKSAFRGMTTLSECMNIASGGGFEAQWIIRGEGLYVAGRDDCFEGLSDPDDMSILYLIEANDGTKGTLVDAYGPYADIRVTEFMRTVKNIPKSEADE